MALAGFLPGTPDELTRRRFAPSAMSSAIETEKSAKVGKPTKTPAKIGKR
jgi:hypothetical protein